MFYRRAIANCALFTLGILVPFLSVAQDTDFLPPDWIGGAEADWLVDVPDWDTLNVRSLPNHKSKKIGTLGPGTIVGIDDRADNNWVYIFSGSIGGWVNSAYLCEASMVKCRYLKKESSTETLKPTYPETRPAPVAVTQTAPSIKRTAPTSTPKPTLFPQDMNQVDVSILDDVDSWAERQGKKTKWLKYDSFYLNDIPKTMNSPQMTVLSLSYSRAEMKLLVDNLFGFVDVAANAIENHPNWTGEDILLEVNSAPLISLDQNQENFVRYMKRNALTKTMLRKREDKLDNRLAKCREHVSQMRPTLRPSNPEEKCVAYIVAQGTP